MALLSNINSSIDELEAAIVSDPSCVARLIQVANSALYGASELIMSVRRAILLLGFDALKDLFSHLPVFDSFIRKNASEVETINGVCLHSLAVARLSHRIAQDVRQQRVEPEAAFCAGLLHDIGVAPEGIDWKADGGYIIAPPSRGALQPYCWKVSPDDVDLAPLPEWLRRIEKISTHPANGSTPDWERGIVRRALTHVDPGSPRDIWLRIGMAVHHASGGSDDGLSLWHAWSAGELHDGKAPDNYSSQADLKTQWASFSNSRESVVTAGTLYAKAAENGFQYAPTLRFRDNATKDSMPELPTASEFLQRTYPEPEFLIGPIQNHNIVIIHGPTGIGKTQMAAAIIKALGAGGSWLHWAVKRPCRVLFIDAELPPGVLQRRLSLHGVDTNNVRILNAIELSGILGQGSHLNLADPHWQDVVWTYVTRYQSEAVLVDNVMSAVSVPGISMLSDEFWKPAYDLALKWRGAGLTSIWMDHSNSAGSIFGTKTKTWNADLVVKLSAPDDHDPEEGCRFVVEYEKHRGLHGELVRGFTAWMDTPEPTLTNIRPDTSLPLLTTTTE